MFNSLGLRRFAFALLLSLLVINANSQENFQPGYIIDVCHDTVHGFIDYQNWSLNPETIKCKAGTNQSIISYSPYDILRFAVEDEYYLAANVEVETSPRGTDRLEYSAAINLAARTVFLQILFEGEKNLFYLNATGGKENFYIGPSEAPELLKYKRYLKVEKGDKDIINENKQYLGQLTYYLKDCYQIDSRIVKTGYDKWSLEKLFDYYYQNTTSEITFKKEAEKTQYKLGLLTGASRSTLLFEGGSDTFIDETIFEPSYNFAAALFLEIVFPRNMRRWSFYNELQYSSYLHSGEFVRFDQPTYYSGYYTEIGATYLKLSNLMRYSPALGDLTVFFSAGVSNDLSLTVTNTQIYKTISNGVENSREDIALDEIRKHQQSIIFGMGFRFHHILLEGRYQLGNGMSPLLGLQSKTQMVSILLGYRF